MRAALAVGLSMALTTPSRGADPVPAASARDVVPLLRRACVECHGPDKQKGGLRLDFRGDAVRGGQSGPAVAPGHPDRGELLRRVGLPAGAEGAMPPRGDRLTAAEVRLLRDWVAQGAPWPAAAAAHWAYAGPVRPRPPAVQAAAWPRSAIDRFVLASLEHEGLTPSPEADRATLLRRVSLDLTGLPPAPAEVDAFLADRSPGAYEAAVDRLLASPQYGVKWARPWLDAARYADSHGFQRDDLRDLWAYRDWVVDALNADLPFDRFTVEQLAGDLLPNATEAQKVATGFNRSAPTNVEAGSDPEETRVAQVFDRVNTLGTVWLGATLECAQCHDHKYDPVSQRDYYRLFAFFNGTAAEAERANPKVPGSIRFIGPEMPLSDATADARRAALKERLAGLSARLARRAEQVKTSDPAWEAAALKSAGAAREHPLDVDAFASLGGATHEVLTDKSVLLSGDPPDTDTYTITVRTRLTDIRAFKLETLTDPSLPGGGPGRGDAARPNFVLNTFAVAAVPAAGGEAKPVRFAGARADFAQARFPAAGAIDADPKTAWAINPQFGRPHWAVFEAADPVGFDGGTVLTVTLAQEFGGGRTIGRLRLSAVTGAAEGGSVPAAVAEALRTPAAKRTAPQAAAVLDYRLAQDPEHTKLANERRKVEAELAALPTPTTLVMKELPAPRSTHIFQRGDFRTPGPRVEPGTPAALHPLDPMAERNRLGLARWLVRPDNALVGRVTVNRLWGELFGVGLVTTPEDFGVRGEPPSHPDLLDWLAVEFVEGGWSQKRLLRTIVLSATYRQSSRVPPALRERDPDNRLLARGPRVRLDAEGIRDNALAVAGLLSLKRGGPPVRPPQPDGLWVKVGGQRYDYVVSPGEDRYRRGLYVVWKRAAPHPSFVAFDADSRLACRVRRPRSNTPLQALTLLNDPVYVEAAVAFARRVVAETPAASADDRLAHAFRVAVSRRPDPGEVAVLRALLDGERAALARDPARAEKLVGGRPPAGVAAAEFAAWYAVCTALLNLDETITKG